MISFVYIFLLSCTSHASFFVAHYTTDDTVFIASDLVGSIRFIKLYRKYTVTGANCPIKILAFFYLYICPSTPVHLPVYPLLQITLSHGKSGVLGRVAEW